MDDTIEQNRPPIPLSHEVSQVVIGPSTPLPEKNPFQTEFSSNLPKKHAALLMRGLLAPLLPHVGALPVDPESPQQCIQSLEELSKTEGMPAQEQIRLENLGRLAQVAFEKLDPGDEHYVSKAQQQELVLGRLVSEAGFIPRNALGILAQSRSDHIVAEIEKRRTSGRLTQTEIEQANQQLMVLSRMGNGALLTVDDLDNFIPELQKNGIIGKVSNAAKSKITQLGKDYGAYFSALSGDVQSQQSQKIIQTWLASSQDSNRNLKELLSEIAQFTVSDERRKEIKTKIINGGKGVAIAFLLLAFVVASTGLSSLNEPQQHG